MIQEITPYIYKNEFKKRSPEESDLVFAFYKGKALMFGIEDVLLAPTVEMMMQTFEIDDSKLTYLFSIDDDAVFLLNDIEYIQDKVEDEIGYDFYDVRVFRTLEPEWIRFAGVTAFHLQKWYNRNHYCGCCGAEMQAKLSERAMECGACGFTDYPKICPAVIVAVTDGDKVLLTKYANRAFTRYALIAGFCEIGESLEATIHREVLEEVGVKVKNLKYFGSQPWGFSESLLMGFVVELDGDGAVTLDTEELKEGVWVNRADVPVDEENGLSLTYTMMQAFREGKI